MMHHYLGMYDVGCDKARYRIFKLLMAFGIHQQRSVFECRLSQLQRKELVGSLQDIVDGSFHRIYLLKIYPNHPHTVMLGQAKRMPASTCLYIG